MADLNSTTIDGFTATVPKIAPYFSSSTNYYEGDIVSYQGNTYIFTQDHAAGAWNIAHVQETTLAEQIANGGGGGCDCSPFMVEITRTTVGMVTNVCMDKTLEQIISAVTSHHAVFFEQDNGVVKIYPLAYMDFGEGAQDGGEIYLFSFENGNFGEWRFAADNRNQCPCVPSFA